MIFQKDRNRERILDPKMLYIDIKNKDKASDSNPFLKEKKKGKKEKGMNSLA